MNEDQTKQILHHVGVAKNCIIIITVLAVIAFAYNAFRVYEYYLGSESQFHASRGFYSDIREASRAGNDNVIVDLCKKKLKQEPHNTWAYVRLGEAYFRLGQWQDCIDTMNSLLEIAPTMEEGILPVLKKAQEKLNDTANPEQSNAG